jgi:superfamily II DNA or RNA helicase
VCLDITQAGPDGPLAIAPVVSVEGAEGPVVPVRFIGTQGHGVLYLDVAEARRGDPPTDWRFRLARLARPVPARWQEMVLAGRGIEVPAAQRTQFRDRFYLRLRQSVAVLSTDGSFTPPVISGPTLVLCASYGEGHDLVLDWQWAYQVGETEYRLGLDQAGDDAGYRDVAAEQAILDAMARDGLGLQRRRLSGMDTARFSAEILPKLASRPGVDVQVTGEPADYREASLLIGVSTDEVAGDDDWFDLGITIMLDGREVPFAVVFTALSLGETYLLLSDGTYCSLDRPQLRRLARLIAEARALQEPGGQDRPLRISRFQAGLWEELAALGVVVRQALAWQQQVQGLLGMDGADGIGVGEPPGTLHAQLRPYQLDGFRWLRFMRQHRLGGILADDMGLGKTVQALAMICDARQAAPGAPPFLIVAPTSVVPNWAAETERFAPQLKAVTITDTLARSRADLGRLTAGADVVITSYTLLRLDFAAHAAAQWSGFILDEAQQAKNYRSKIYQCVRRLPAPVKIAMTGTPMENNLMELWALLSITAPGLFPDPERFREYYVRPIERKGDTELLASLRRRIRPLVRRRTKEQVAADLPSKQEQVLMVDLHPRHRKVYQTHLQRERQKVLGLIDDVDANRFTILGSLTKLRQLSLHAALIDDAHNDIPSAKIDALLDQISSVAAGGHRALVFSQFTRFLALVRERLDEAGVGSCYLDGKTRDRAAAVRQFRDGTDPVFLISLKAGGFGLNLTEADYCFLLDPWWNPATEVQAIDRTHRIGQTRNVMVYRLIAAGTIEEKVMALQARKAALFSQVVDDGNAFGGSLDADDIRGLFT